MNSDYQIFGIKHEREGDTLQGTMRGLESTTIS